MIVTLFDEKRSLVSHNESICNMRSRSDDCSRKNRDYSEQMSYIFLHCATFPLISSVAIINSSSQSIRSWHYYCIDTPPELDKAQ